MSDTDDENDIMRDLTPEEMAQGMINSNKYVSKVFLDKKHYQKIHKTLSSKWDRLHSLSAAVKLMETYGVQLTPEEETRLSTMDEGQQINALVSKMPQQSNDQFQQFFLQLQLLVSTAMRVRRSLEEGRPDEVESALEDADTTGIATYILRVAIVQAGTEVETLKAQFESWTREADNKMGRLIRGQQDNLTAQKKLAQVEAELARQNGEQNAKTAKAVINFAKGNDKAFVLMVLQSWQTAAKFMGLEAKLKLEYADRLKDLEDNLAKWKAGQCSKTQNVILKKIQQDQWALLGRVFDIWRKDVDDEKFMREHGDKVLAMEERLANAKSSQKENATKVLGGMASASEHGLVDLTFKGWIQVRNDTIKQKQLQDSRLAAESKLDMFTQGKSEEAKYLVQSFSNASSTGLVHACMTAWITLYDERKKEAEIAEMMHKSKSKMESFGSRSKASSGSVMNRAGQHMQHMLCLRCFNCWRLDSKMEHTMKFYHLKVDAKRQQLVGVQQMFRKFAEQLEGAAGGKQESGKDTSRLFDNHSKDKDKDKAKRGMSKNQNSLSLPEIKNKPNSGRAGSRPVSSGRVGGGNSPTEGGVPPPRTAWS